MKENKKSGSAVFMDIMMVLTVVISAVCFILYYCGIFKNGVVLWVGIVAFMILYQFFLRIFSGNITKRIRIDRKAYFFREKPFEKKLYRILRVRKWRDKVLTYDPDAFSLKKHSWDEIADAMTKAELDHWINEIISLTSILFSLLWGHTALFAIVAVLVMLFDAQFIALQRFNRPKVEKIVNSSKKQKKPEYSEVA